jgi:hypothetical protein
MAPPLRIITLDQREWMELQENVQRVVNPLATNPSVGDVRFLADLGDGLEGGIPLLAAGTTLVPHRLNRPVRGWRVVDTTADARVWRDTTSTEPADRFLALRCSANTTVKLEVF